MLAVLVVFGGLVAAAAAVIVVSFFRVSNAPLSDQPYPGGVGQDATVRSVAQAPAPDRTGS